MFLKKNAYEIKEEDEFVFVLFSDKDSHFYYQEPLLEKNKIKQRILGKYCCKMVF